MQLPPEICDADGMLAEPQQVLKEILRLPHERDRWHALVGAYVFLWKQLQCERRRAESSARAAQEPSEN